MSLKSFMIGKHHVSLVVFASSFSAIVLIGALMLTSLLVPADAGDPAGPDINRTDQAGTARENGELNIVESSCRAPNDQYASDFDWGAINSDDDFAECLLRVARSLETQEAMAEWLGMLGFANVTAISNTPNRIYLNAIWDVEAAQSRIPFAANLPIFERWVSRGKDYRVQVIYDDSLPTSVNAHHMLK